MKQVIFLRGFSGAGKTSLQKRMFPNACVVSMDTLRMQQGYYHYNESQTLQIKETCYELFLAALERGEELIVIDNTNLTVTGGWRYYEAAIAVGYNFSSILLLCNPEVAYARNSHNTPWDAYMRMMQNIRYGPPEWDECIIQTD